MWRFGSEGSANSIQERTAILHRMMLFLQWNGLEPFGSSVRELMKDYSGSFYRNQQVAVDKIKYYYAKIEREGTFRAFEKQVVENAPYRKEVATLSAKFLGHFWSNVLGYGL